ncbi:hypothetical protein CCP4SC76_2080003 [Gammaproteobacteria bacterium]
MRSLNGYYDKTHAEPAPTLEEVWRLFRENATQDFEPRAW